MTTPKPIPGWLLILIVVFAVAGTSHIIVEWGWIAGTLICIPGLWWTYKQLIGKWNE